MNNKEFLQLLHVSLVECEFDLRKEGTSTSEKVADRLAQLQGHIKFFVNCGSDLVKRDFYEN